MGAPADPIGELLRELGHPGDAPGDEDGLRALDALLRAEPALAPRALDRLLGALARTKDEETAGLLALGCGLARLVAGDARSAGEQLAEGLALLGRARPAAAVRGALLLARAEIATGAVPRARSRLARVLPAVVETRDELLLADFEGALAGAGDGVASELVARLRAERRERGAPATSLGPKGASKGAAGAGGAASRLEIVARLAHALNSSIAGTAEPLYAILRAVLDETGAERGFIMLYDGGQLRFELGLARDGRVLGSEQFAFSTTIVERTLEQGRAVLVPDVARTLPYAQASSARDLGLRAALAAPLRVERKRPGATRGASLESLRGIAGVLYVDATSAASFGEEDARFLETLADFAVIALRATRTAAAPAPPPPPRRAEPPERARRAEGPERPRRGEGRARPASGIVTGDAALLAVLKTIERAASSEANVLFKGESGTGKELLARALHAAARGADAPFVAVDCGALSDDLLQSELFGHEANAFTGAGEARAGLFEQADRGTLFLDEIGTASSMLQATLVRALQEGEVRRVGGAAPLPVNVRIVSATNRDLRALVEAGSFRQDLLFRIAAIEVRVPPLRERAGDVPLLVAHFLEKQGLGSGPDAIEPEAIDRLEEHGWPGNVRELENVLSAATVVSAGPITLATVDQVLASAPRGKPRAAAPPDPDGTLESIERAALQDRLARFGWNQVQAAASLGIDRNTLRRKILRYGIVRGRE